MPLENLTPRTWGLPVPPGKLLLSLPDMLECELPGGLPRVLQPTPSVCIALGSVLTTIPAQQTHALLHFYTAVSPTDHGILEHVPQVPFNSAFSMLLHPGC